MAKTTKTSKPAKASKTAKTAKKKAATGKAPPATARAKRLAAPPTPPKAVRKADARVLSPLTAAVAGADAAILDRLWDVVEERRIAADAVTSHSARLLARGTAKIAQKLGEEAVECVIEAAIGNHQATVLESADLLYHLVIVWVDAGIRPQEVWAELARRQGISGIAEKAARPAGILRTAGTRKLP